MGSACAANSYVTLEFEDGSQLRVQPNSQIRLDAAWVYGDAGFFAEDVALRRGRTESSVPPENRATITVTGIDARVDYLGARHSLSSRSGRYGSATRSEVEHGQVSVVARGGRCRSTPGSAALRGRARRRHHPFPVAAPDLAGLPPLLERVPLRFELAPLAGATGYHARVATDSHLQRLGGGFQRGARPSCTGRTLPTASTGYGCAAATSGH